jgi:Rps23 Pro-64 3,4-dihydroxylase Tpa1-like proline 4-hydroxylase
MDGRRLTLVLYLNPGWTTEQGGAIRLTPPAAYLPPTASGEEAAEAIDVYPVSGRMVMFYSADIPHEVMATFGDRHAMTIW